MRDMAEPEELRPPKVDRKVIGPNRWGNTPEKRKIINPMLTYQEAHEGNLRAFNKGQLRYDKNGRKVRTDIPRPMPSDDFDFRKKRRGEECG